MRIILFILLGIMCADATATAEPIRVVDGDTIRAGDKLVRLVGLNAPESGGRALCDRERRLGIIAKARLKEIIERGGIALRIVPCACKPGTEGTETCNFGRACGVLTSRGQDVAGMLIADGLAVPFHCGPISCPRLPRPWCGGDR